MSDADVEPRTELGRVAEGLADVIGARTRGGELDGGNGRPALDADDGCTCGCQGQVHGVVPGRTRGLGVVVREALDVGPSSVHGGGRRTAHVRHVIAEGGGQVVGVGAGACGVAGGLEG